MALSGGARHRCRHVALVLFLIAGRRRNKEVRARQKRCRSVKKKKTETKTREDELQPRRQGLLHATGELLVVCARHAEAEKEAAESKEDRNSAHISNTMFTVDWCNARRGSRLCSVGLAATRRRSMGARSALARNSNSRLALRQSIEFVQLSCSRSSRLPHRFPFPISAWELFAAKCPCLPHCLLAMPRSAKSIPNQ